MPSLAPATYHHYYPSGVTDIDSTFGSICKLKRLLFSIAALVLCCLLFDYGSTAIFVIEHDAFPFLYPCYRPLMVSLPFTAMLYIFWSMTFHPLTLRHSYRRHIAITTIWSAVLTLSLCIPIATLCRCPSESAPSGAILEGVPSSVLLYPLTMLSMFTLSASALFIFQIWPKSKLSMAIQLVFCCKLRFWRTLCLGRSLKIHHAVCQRMDVHLLSQSMSGSSCSEMLSDFEVDNEDELRSKFLSEDIDLEDGEASSLPLDDRGPGCCVRTWSRCCFWFYGLDPAHKLLLLLLVLDGSITICVAMVAAFDGGGGESAYLQTMTLWLAASLLAKLWLKAVGKQLDITRIELEGMATAIGRATSPRSVRIQQIREWTNRTASARASITEPLGASPQSVGPSTESKTACSAKQHYQSVTVSATATDFKSIEEEVNALRFEMSAEVAAEMAVKAAFYGFYRKQSLLVRPPTFSDFIAFQAVHCAVIFAFYHIRVLPAYYHGSYWLRRAIDSALRLHREPDFNHFAAPQTAARWRRRNTETFSAYDPRFRFESMDRGQTDHDHTATAATATAATAIDGAYLSVPTVPPLDADDPDTQYVDALDALRSLYALSAKSTLHSSRPNTPHGGGGLLTSMRSITFHQYGHWRQRLCIDCALSCCVMVAVTVQVYGAVLVLYLCGRYGLDLAPRGQGIDDQQLRTSTAFFVVAMVTELWLYGMLYLTLRFCDPEESFNLFRPFVALYVKAANPAHYALLIVMSSWWVLL